MSLQVIGSGFGRTGTMSVKKALGVLGLGPCHHMTEVMESAAQLDFWKTIAAGEAVDWEVVFGGYNSQVDWPGAHVWHETSIAFPDARVIHTERPEDDWWASFNGTIGKFFASFSDMDIPPHFVDLFDTMNGLIMKQTFEDFTDRDSAIAAYRLNNQRVRDTIPAERLLVFNVADGWEPLCRFLELPIPGSAFPHRHPKREFWEHFGGEPG